MKLKQKLSIIGHVVVKDVNTNEVLLDQYNTIHPENMPRILARGLANEPNFTFATLQLGNAGIIVDEAGNSVVQSPPISTWNSTLYNPTYSVILDETNPSFDPTGGTGVTSTELGNKSIVTVTAYISNAKPGGELASSTISSPSGAELDFNFSEMGIFCKGLTQFITYGTSSVDVGNHVSTDEFPIAPNSVLTLECVVNSTSYTSTITMPAGGSGAGGVITFGDFCQGFNSGAWITGGAPLNIYLYTYITDFTNGNYLTLSNPPIAGLPLSYGNLVFTSKIAGPTSNVTLSCTSGNASDFFNQLTSNNCGYVNINQSSGQNAGVQNDATEIYNTCPPGTSMEAMRMLTYINFNSVLKAYDRSIKIVYSLTISVTPSQDSSVSQTTVQST